MAPYPPIEIPMVPIACRPNPMRWHNGISSSITMAMGSSPGCGFQYPPPPSADAIAIGGSGWPATCRASACGGDIPVRTWR
jgi:hypothetical protein